MTNANPVLETQNKSPKAKTNPMTYRKWCKTNQVIYRKWCLLSHWQASCFLAFSLVIYLNLEICIQIDLSLCMKGYFNIQVGCQTYV